MMNMVIMTMLLLLLLMLMLVTSEQCVLGKLNWHICMYVCTTHIHEYELLLLLSACALNARQQQRIRISNACGDWDFCYVRFV